MPLTINDSTYPPATPLTFASVGVGDVFRQEANSQYYRKNSETTAYGFTENDIVAVSAATLIQPVTAELVISAP